MALLSPPKYPSSGLKDIKQIAAALLALQEYQRTVYNQLRVVALRMDTMAQLDLLSQTISNPPTQAQVQNIQNTVNAILTAARQVVSAN